MVAHFHYVMVGGATALIGGLYYWFPKITGRMYDETLGKLHFGMYFVGFNMVYFPMFVVWQTPRRVFEYDAGFTVWHRIATIGAFLLAASFLVMFYNLFRSLHHGEEAPDNPWEYASSAEWVVPSPPPLETFPGSASFASGSLKFLGTGDDDSTEGSVPGTAPDGGQRAETNLGSDGGQPVSTGTATGEAAIVPEPAPATPASTAHETETVEHADHASIWPFMVSLSAFVTFLGLSGLGDAYVVWPFVFGLAFFVGYLGVEGMRREGFSVIHAVFWLLGAGVLGAGLYVFGLDKGSVAAGLNGASPYFWVTTAGTALGGSTLISMGWESFSVPEPTASLNAQYPFEKIENTKLGMWMFLATDVVLFGALVGSYLFLRVANGWDHWHDLIPEAHTVTPGLINTYLLLGSSFAVVLALVAARHHNRRGLIAYLTLTFGLGVGFLVNKALEWIHLFNLHGGEFAGGWGFETNVASSTFYLTTGLHGAHVIVGLLITLFLIVRAYDGAYMGEEDARTVEYFGLYWHFVDIVWLFLFPLFYII